MATGGWGGTGAWGAPPKATTTRFDDDEEEVQPAYNAPQPTYNAPQPAYNAPPGRAPSSRQEPLAPQAPAAAFGGGSFGGGSFGGGSSSGKIETGNKEAQLKKREAELDAKEKQLKALEAELKASGVVIKKKNWPICVPLIHHDIPGEIPEKSRRVVREIYLCWYGLCLCFAWNFFCASTMLGTNDQNRIGSWFLAIIYTILGIPIAFWGWYLSIYDSAKSESTLGYIKFFIFFLVNIGFCIYAAIAPQFSAASWSFAGWMTAFSALNVSNFVGIVYIVGACLWTLLAVYSMWCMKDAYLFFRGKGGIEQAKQDAAVAAFKAGVQNQQTRPPQAV